MKTGENTVVRFGEFTLDRARHRLSRNGQRLHLTPRPFATLAYLVAHPDQAVGKHDLISAVWQDVAVSDGSLAQAIREARKVLGDDDKDPRYIQTVPRVGYRFIAPVLADDPPPTALPQDAPVETGRPLHLKVAAMAAVLLAGVALWSLRSGLADRIFSRPNAVAHETLVGGQSVRQVTSGPFNAVKPQYSPDGTSLLYLSHDPDSVGLDLFMIGVGGGTPRQLTKGVGATGDEPVFTADGSRIVFSRLRTGEDGTRLRDLWAIPSSGGTPALLLAEASGAGFSPDGTEMAYTKYVAGGKALWRGLVRDSGSHRELAPHGFAPRWSPDGRWIAFTTSDPGGGSGHLWMVSASAAGEPVRLTAEAEDTYGITWARDSQAIFIASDRGQGIHLRKVPISGGPATAITAGVGHYAMPTVSPDGRMVAFSHSRPFATLLLSEPIASSQSRRLGAEGYHLGHLWPRLSPSGRRVASIVRLHEGERLWVTDADTGERLGVGDRPGAHPDWLDDDRVAYLTSAERPAQRTEVRVMAVGAGVTSKWFEIAGKASWLAVRPDQNAVAFVARRAAETQAIVLRDPRSGSERVIASGGEYEALRWRPDGRVLAWSGPAEGGNVASNGVWVLDADGEAAHQIVKDGYSPAWAADGSALYFVRVRGTRESAGLWRYDFARNAVTKVRGGSGVQQIYFDVAGDRLVVASNNTTSQIFEMRLTP